MKLTRHAFNRNSLFFAGAILTLAGLMFLGTAFGGRALLISGHVWPSDIIFGFDIQRNILDMSEPGHNQRGNVHPLFPHLAKPFSYAIQAVGVSSGLSAIVLNAMAGACGVLITAWYLRLRGVGRLDAWLACALMTSSATFIIQSALPGTYIFSLCIIGLSNILLFWQLTRPDPLRSRPLAVLRECAWVATGVLNYGLTITNGFMSFMTYGLGRKGIRGWCRSVAYGAAVLGLGLALSWLLGSSLNIAVERRWLTDDPERGPNMAHPFAHSFSTFLAWGFVAPAPQITTSLDPRHWKIAALLGWDYSWLGWMCVLAWLSLLGFALVRAALQQGSIDRRLNLSLAASFLFHALGHSFYYVTWEGVFVYSSHSLFLVMGAFAPMLAAMEKFPAAARWLIRGLMLLLAAVLIARHFTLLFDLREIVPLPEGYGPS